MFKVSIVTCRKLFHDCQIIIVLFTLKLTPRKTSSVPTACLNLISYCGTFRGSSGSKFEAAFTSAGCHISETFDFSSVFWFFLSWSFSDDSELWVDADVSISPWPETSVCCNYPRLELFTFQKIALSKIFIWLISNINNVSL